MSNDKLLLSLFALGVMSLLGLTYYFFSDSGRDAVDNTMIMNETTQPQQHLSTFAPPPARPDKVSDAPIIVENKNESDDYDFSEANEVNEVNKATVDNQWQDEILTPTQTPVEFVQRYFRDLKNVPYEQTWAMQSASFQAQNTLEKHAKWWSKQVDSVDVDKVIAVDAQTVTVRLRYRMKNGRKVCSIDTFSVIKAAQGWLLDGQKYRNCR